MLETSKLWIDISLLLLDLKGFAKLFSLYFVAIPLNSSFILSYRKNTNKRIRQMENS